MRRCAAQLHSVTTRFHARRLCAVAPRCLSTLTFTSSRVHRPSTSTSGPRLCRPCGSACVHTHAAVAADAGVVLVPSLGDSIVDGTLSAWEVAVGQAVNVDDVVAVLETDKVSFEVRTDMAGTLAEQLANEGDTVAVGQPLFRVDESAAATASDAADASPAATDDAPLEEIDVPVPNLGDSITEGTVAGVHAGPGTVVAMDEVVVEVDTDKVTSEIRAPVAGTIVEVYAAEGDNITVGENLFRMAPSSGDVPAAAAAVASSADAPAAAAAPATTTGAGASTGQQHAHRVPLIRFRHGKRDEVPPAAAQHQPHVAAAPVVTQSGTGALEVTVSTVGSYLDLPPMFGRPAMTDAELEMVDSGGAEAW